MVICPSRKSTHSIMNHSGFGELKVIKNGKTVIVPAHYISKCGTIKKVYRDVLEQYLDA